MEYFFFLQADALFSIENAQFGPLSATLSRIYAIFGVLLKLTIRGMLLWLCFVDYKMVKPELVQGPSDLTHLRLLSYNM